MILTSKNKKALQSVKPFLCPPSPKKTQHIKRENDFLKKFAIFELFGTLVLKQFLLANLHETAKSVKSLSANALKSIYS